MTTNTNTAVELSEDGRTLSGWVALPGAGPAGALRALTDPDLLRSWWGGELTAELRPGGPYVVRFPALDQTMRGQVLAYDPAALLHITWSWEHEPHVQPREVTIRAVAVPDGARLELTHGPFGDSAEERTEAGNHLEGWAFFLPRLAAAMRP